MQDELDRLVGMVITDVFYHSSYEGYATFEQLSEYVQEVPLLGILLYAGSGDSFTISDTDYAPHFGFGGIKVFKDDYYRDPDGRPSHINEEEWSRFRDTSIRTCSIIEAVDMERDHEYRSPSGICLDFENSESLYVFNVIVGGYDDESNTYQLVHGADLTIFFDTEAVRRHHLLEEMIFRWNTGT